MPAAWMVMLRRRSWHDFVQIFVNNAGSRWALAVALRRRLARQKILYFSFVSVTRKQENINIMSCKLTLYKFIFNILIS